MVWSRYRNWHGGSYQLRIKYNFDKYKLQCSLTFEQAVLDRWDTALTEVTKELHFRVLITSTEWML